MKSPGRKDAYLRRTAHVLGACQFVEFQLKSYIAEALELARKCVDERVPFKLEGRDYENESLGKLITLFKKLSDCPALIERLEKFSRERNFVAHRAIQACIDPDGELDYVASRKHIGRLAKIEKEANQLKGAIYEEALKIRANLDFFDLDRDRVPARRS